MLVGDEESRTYFRQYRRTKDLICWSHDDCSDHRAGWMALIATNVWMVNFSNCSRTSSPMAVRKLPICAWRVPR